MISRLITQHPCVAQLQLVKILHAQHHAFLDLGPSGLHVTAATEELSNFWTPGMFNALEGQDH